MKNNTIKTAALLCASLSLAWIQPVPASPPKDKAESLLEKLKDNNSAQNQCDLKAVSKNGDGKITYNGEEVWKGRVEDGLTAIAKVISSDESEYSEGTEVAAVWDGDKLVWENIKGAADELQPEFKKLQERRNAALKELKELK